MHILHKYSLFHVFSKAQTAVFVGNQLDQHHGLRKKGAGHGVLVIQLPRVLYPKPQVCKLSDAVFLLAGNGYGAHAVFLCSLDLVAHHRGLAGFGDAEKHPHPLQRILKDAHRVAARGADAQNAHVDQLLGQVGAHRTGKAGAVDKDDLVFLLQDLFRTGFKLRIGIVVQQRLHAKAVEKVFFLLHRLVRRLGKGAQLVAHIHKTAVIHLARQPHDGGGGGIVCPRHPAHALGLHRVQMIQNVLQHGLHGESDWSTFLFP